VRATGVSRRFAYGYWTDLQFADKSGHYAIQPPSFQLINWLTWPNLSDTLWTLIPRMGEGAYLTLFWLWRQPIHRKTILTYQCQYFAIGNTISECNLKLKIPKTRTIDWNCRIQENPAKPTGLTVMGMGLAHHDPAGQYFGLLRNRPNSFWQSEFGPLVGHPDSLLILVKVLFLFAVSLHSITAALQVTHRVK